MHAPYRKIGHNIKTLPIPVLCQFSVSLFIQRNLLFLGWFFHIIIGTIHFLFVLIYSPPTRRQWARRDRPQQGILIQDDNSFRATFFPVDEHRVFALTSTPPRMLHPAAHSTQQTPFMVDLHEQVIRFLHITRRMEI